MNFDPAKEHTMSDMNPLNKALGHLFWPSQMDPNHDPDGPADGLRTARWAAAALTALSTAVQLIVWLMICVVSQSIESPWWLWSTIPGVIVTAFLSWMISTRDQIAPRAAQQPKAPLV